MKTIIGFLIALFAFITGFAMAAGGHGGGLNFGAAGGLLHITELISIGGILIGGLLSFLVVLVFSQCFPG
jgi:hypothetical protein